MMQRGKNNKKTLISELCKIKDHDPIINYLIMSIIDNLEDEVKAEYPE